MLQSTGMTIDKLVLRRLRPLFWAAFFQSFVFWYAVELLLAKHIGVSDYSVGLVTAATSVATVLVEVPAGILADAWSRKGVLIIASGFSLVSTLFGVIADSPWQFYVFFVSWGIFYALYTGTYESITYDVLLEETGSGREYERVYGMVGRFESAALVSSSVIGGFLAILGIRVPFFATIPMLVLSIVFLLIFREPVIHKAHDQSVVPLGKKFASTIGVVFSSKLSM